MTNILLDSGIKTTNYDTLLINLDSQTLQNGLSFNAGSVQCSAGAAATARANIISNHSWTITDGGQAP